MSDNSIPPLGSVWRKKTGEHAGELVTVVERNSVKFRTANGELWTASVSSWNEKMAPFVEMDLVEELRNIIAIGPLLKVCGLPQLRMRMKS